MKLASIVILVIGIIATGSAQMKFVEDSEKGTLTIFDGQIGVLTYCSGNQLRQGLDPKHTRSCYIHPLFSLNGRALTDDFPEDHLHHHGVSWTWPVVKTRGQDTQTWQSVTPSLRLQFVRWVKRAAGWGRNALTPGCCGPEQRIRRADHSGGADVQGGGADNRPGFAE